MELEGNTSRGGVTWEYMHACDSIVPLAIFLNAQFLEKTEPLLIRSYWLAEVTQFTAKHTRDGNCRLQILVVYISGTFRFFLKSDKPRFPLFKKTFLYTYSSAAKTATSGKTLHDATVSTIATSKIPCDLE